MPLAEFMVDEAVDYARSFTDATGIACSVLDRKGGLVHPHVDQNPCRMCRISSGGDENDTARHWRWVEQATRFGGRYIFMCENSFTHWTSPIMVEGRAVGAFVAGPVLTIEESDFVDSALFPRGNTGDRKQALETLFGQVPRIRPERVTPLSKILYGLARSVSDTSGRMLEEADSELERQSRMNEYIQDLKDRQRTAGTETVLPPYPLDKEQELLDQIRLGSISRAQKTLNDLLGHVFFASGSDVGSLRYRSRELVALLSRAVLNEGADPEEVFGLNFRFVEALDHQTDINGIAFWMARIARRFADLVLYMPNVQHGTVMRKAARYVRTHLSDRIRVADVSEHVGLSPSYFSRLFAREMKVSFVSYVTRMRLDRAKDLLRSTNTSVTEIAAEVGIPDHSYFTKLFRHETGFTPTAYRRGEEGPGIGSSDELTDEIG